MTKEDIEQAIINFQYLGFAKTKDEHPDCYYPGSDLYFRDLTNGWYIVINHFNQKGKPDRQVFDCWRARYTSIVEIGKTKPMVMEALKQPFRITSDFEWLEKYIRDANASQKLFNLAYDAYTTRELIEIARNLPIHRFRDEIPDGPILEIGYELGGLAMYFASKGRIVYAVDKEPYYEAQLKNRIVSEPFKNNIKISISELPDGPLPEMEFALININHVLHFLQFEQSQVVIKRLAKLLKPGGFIFIQNHHKKHLYAKNRKTVSKNAKSFYKHFFSEKEMEFLLPNSEFSEKYVGLEKVYNTQKHLCVQDEYLNYLGYRSNELRNELRKNYKIVDYHLDLTTIHQKLTIGLYTSGSEKI